MCCCLSPVMSSADHCNHCRLHTLTSAHHTSGCIYVYTQGPRLGSLGGLTSCQLSNTCLQRTQSCITLVHNHLQHCSACMLLSLCDIKIMNKLDNSGFCPASDSSGRQRSVMEQSTCYYCLEDAIGMATLWPDNSLGMASAMYIASGSNTSWAMDPFPPPLSQGPNHDVGLSGCQSANRCPVSNFLSHTLQVEGQAWYGGGCDLTPAYLFEEDARHFHSFWKATCDKHHTDLYTKYKAWCDDYFYIPARQEHRGIGGIFFDDLEAKDAAFDVSQFVEDVAEGILSSWRDIATKRQAMPFSHEQRQWQLLRRGRYLEFNLLYDRGVKFGLSGGRLESIMVSAPPLIAWRYNVVPEAGSAEAKLVAVLQKPVEWASHTT
ncbi:TPA: hypothetical protein ACH3X2_007602 [Trebouxia sp. C0005]